MENNYGITPEIDIWTVDFSYFSHVKRNTETFVTAVSSPNILVLITEMPITIYIFNICSTLTKYCKSQCEAFEMDKPRGNCKHCADKSCNDLC